MCHAMGNFILFLFLAPAASLDIVCGWYHNCVFERGTTAMKCWGVNSEKQLGYDDINDRGADANEMGSNLPLVNLGNEFIVEDMRLGRYHSCAMSDDTAVKCFGSNGYSQLGFDGATTTGDALPFVEFGVDFNLSKIAAGWLHTCALSTDATLKCFGRNDDGQCGAGTNLTTISGPPSQINAVALGTNFTPIDVNTFHIHVCILSQQGTLKCFGYNGQYQLGYGDSINRGETPESMGDGLPIVDLGSNFIVAAIATGAWHSCALSTTKTVKCWGWNASGQCGTPHSTETGDNLPVLEFGADFVPMQLVLGGYHTCVLSEAAALICFGYNLYGQLGIGSTTDVGTPSTLTGIDLGSNFVPRQVAAGWFHTCAVSTDDGIKCWGDNQYGQLGLGHLNNTGDGANEMGDNLPFVDVAWPTASPTTSSPTTTSPTASPSTTSPTTTSPSKATPTTATPTTAAIEATTEPTTSGPTTENPTTAQPTTQSPTTVTTTPTSNNNTVTVTIRTESLSSTQILIAIAKVYNSSSTPLTITTLSSDDDEDGFAAVELLVAVPSNVELDYDVIEATLREAMVDEYGDDIKVDIDVHGDDKDEGESGDESFNFLDWRLTVVLCIASVCFCFAVAGALKCILVNRRQRGMDNHNQIQEAQIELAERPRPMSAAAVVMPNAHGLHSESEEKKEDINPGVNPGAGGEPDLELEESVSNRHEGRRASVAAQSAAVTAGMAADEFEVADDHETDAGCSANFVRAEATPAGIEEDEFEVVDDDSNQVNTAGHTRSE